MPDTNESSQSGQPGQAMQPGQSKQLPSGTTEHRLSNEARKQWWQRAHIWAIRLKPNNYTNQCLMAQLLFLIQLPVMMLMWIFSAHALDPAIIKMLLLTLSVWFAALAVFAWTFSHHLRKIMVARVSNEMLELQSLSYKRKLHWLNIEAVFPVRNSDLGQDEYVLVCRNGELFFLGRELSNCEELIQSIKKHLPPEEDHYETNYCVPYGHFDTSMISVFAIMVAVTFGPLKWLIFDTHHRMLELLLTFSPVIIVGLIAWAFLWYHYNRVPQIVRIGKNNVYLKTRSSAYTVPLDQITTGKFGRMLTLKSRAGKFLIYTSTKELLGQKLIEFNSQSMSQTK